MRSLKPTLLAILACTQLHAAEFRGRIVDSNTGEPLAARVYLTDAGGNWFFVRSTAANGTVVRYDKTNWFQKESFEKHTTVSAHPFRAELPAGEYTITVERGKEYFPETKTVTLGQADVEVDIRLRRWINLAERGWFSGDTHIHRTLDELPNTMLAEDLNVTLPLTYWVTKSGTPPTSGDKNIGGEIPDKLITIDPTHVIWPRNTEYEIFTVGPKRHTLGALFFLNHKSVFDEGVPPWGPLARRARAEGAIFDMDKLDWQFSMILPHATDARLYELSNNHMWRTKFAYTKWNSQTPGFLQPPAGAKQGNEEEWINYTLGQFYVLKNAGFPLVATAGSANGVHPVPAGFSRVYVHQPNGFSYENWLNGLKAGNSFVTTGPMLFAKINGQQAGHTFELGTTGDILHVTGEIISETPVSFAEIIVNGTPVILLRGKTNKTSEDAFRMEYSTQLKMEKSGWIAIRCYEERQGGRLRFAHTSCWDVVIPGKPLRPSPEEKEYLIQRVQTEIDRSKGIVSQAAIDEYEGAIRHYHDLKTSQANHENARLAKRDDELKNWLTNMITHHRFSNHEAAKATGLSHGEVQQKVEQWNIQTKRLAKRTETQPIKILPYPGGRHPRIGFLDGALLPQRETKFSVFAPWNPHSYAVIDVPEAVWSNLGLTYLAHTHIPTVWDKKEINLPRLEWTQNGDGSLSMERTLPNGIVFGSHVQSSADLVKMRLWIRNGTDNKLTGLRAQVCTMLKGMPGFNQRIKANKVTRDNMVATRDEDGDRWLITGWQPLHRPWVNPPVPCVHADPAFPDCLPGKTVEATGIVTFFEGKDISQKLEQLAKIHFPE